MTLSASNKIGSRVENILKPYDLHEIASPPLLEFLQDDQWRMMPPAAVTPYEVIGNAAQRLNAELGFFNLEECNPLGYTLFLDSQCSIDKKVECYQTDYRLFHAQLTDEERKSFGKLITATKRQVDTIKRARDHMRLAIENIRLPHPGNYADDPIIVNPRSFGLQWSTDLGSQIFNQASHLTEPAKQYQAVMRSTGEWLNAIYSSASQVRTTSPRLNFFKLIADSSLLTGVIFAIGIAAWQMSQNENEQVIKEQFAENILGSIPIISEVLFCKSIFDMAEEMA